MKPLAATALLAGLALAAGGCGDKAGDATQPATAAGRGLDPYLMRAGDEPGFRPGALPGAMPRSLQRFEGVGELARGLSLPPAEVRRLRSDGFVAFTVGPIRGPRNTAGLTNVALHETPAGARRSMAHDLRADVIRGSGPLGGLRFFTVAGIPGARGWTASDPHLANVSWVQGRCYLTLGNQGPGALVARLSTGARAIYRRTHGQCP